MWNRSTGDCQGSLPMPLLSPLSTSEMMTTRFTIDLCSGSRTKAELLYVILECFVVLRIVFCPHFFGVFCACTTRVALAPTTPTHTAYRTHTAPQPHAHKPIFIACAYVVYIRALGEENWLFCSRDQRR